jgi:hypothetical protein
MKIFHDCAETNSIIYRIHIDFKISIAYSTGIPKPMSGRSNISAAFREYREW